MTTKVRECSLSNGILPFSMDSNSTRFFEYENVIKQLFTKNKTLNKMHFAIFNLLSNVATSKDINNNQLR